MRVKEFCKRLQIHRSTVVRLEAKGLLDIKRDWAGHRRFTEQDVTQAEKILYQAQSRKD